MSQIEIINQEISQEISKAEVATQLLATTFKGLTVPVMKQALFEGMTRGFTFKDFLEKNIYAIPFGGGYSLVTSIDYARKLGMRSGVVGVSEPTYEMNDTKIVSCAVTVKRKINDYVGEYTAKVYFDEYTSGRNLWTSKPRTMIAKVAEMHALRKACPEELAQAYAEEELQKVSVQEVAIDIVACAEKIESTKSIDELKNVWKEFTPNERNAEELKSLFITQKNKISSENEPA